MPVIFPFWQRTKSPRRQGSQVKQWPPCHPTPTRWPGFQLVTSAPTASMRPAISCPGIRGYWMPGQWPSFTRASLWQIPQASTLMRTWPRAGSGMFLSTSSRFPPALLTWTTFIRDILFPFVSRFMECCLTPPVIDCGSPKMDADWSAIQSEKDIEVEHKSASVVPKEGAVLRIADVRVHFERIGVIRQVRECTGEPYCVFWIQLNIL